MLTYTNSYANGQTGNTSYSLNPAILTGGASAPRVFVWCATARNNEVTPGGRLGNKFDQATRTSSSCYMVGLKESIAIQVADGLPWQWRRICFTYKGLATLGGALPSPNGAFYPSVETSNGYCRVLNQLTEAEQTQLWKLVFQGEQASDWNEPLTAKADNELISVKYDKTITVASGNEQGIIRKYNRWHGMGHNLQYADDEKGGANSAAAFSAQSRIGMGDYWIIDLFKPRVGSASTNQLLLNCESTLYWHEK